MRRILLPMAGAIALSLAAGPIQAAEVEVLHWWTSGGEAAALTVLKKDLEAKGITWKDMPVAGGGGTQAMTVLRARVSSGEPPTAVQMLGFDILDWAEQGVLGDLNDLAAEEKWDAVVPAALQKFSKYDGNWIAAPVNVHSTNWIWANKAVFDKLGIAQPTNWDELIAALDKIKAAGLIPLAHGGQAWQDATIFDSVVLTTGGPDFYKKALIDLDAGALGSDTMKQVFDRMAQLRTYVDPNFPGRDWNLASAMVIKGEAGMQIMGDWAKGEFLAAGKTPGKDFVCVAAPGTAKAYTFNVDSFALFKVKGDDKVKAQKDLASAIMSTDFQELFNLNKGSIPVRLGMKMDKFDDCAKTSSKDFVDTAKAGALVPSIAHGMAVPSAVEGAIKDAVSQFWNDDKMSSKDAQTKIAAAAKTK